MIVLLATVLSMGVNPQTPNLPQDMLPVVNKIKVVTPKKVKSCSCTPDCSCGCNVGNPCRCKTIKYTNYKTSPTFYPNYYYVPQIRYAAPIMSAGRPSGC